MNTAGAANSRAAKIKTNCELKAVSFSGETLEQVEPKEITSQNRSSSGPSSGKKVTCTVLPHSVSKKLDISSVVLNSYKPTISGISSDAEKIQLQLLVDESVGGETGTKTIYKKTIKVKNGKWKAKGTKKLYDGEYEILVSDAKHSSSDSSSRNVLRGVLTVSTSSPSTKSTNKTNSATTFVAESVPLLFGGTARAGDSVPISYLQITNVGNESATLKGFSVTQNGSASVQSVVGFTVIDDLGLSVSSTGSTDIVEGTTPFRGRVAYIPVTATFGPNQMRLFTIKAVVGRNVFSDLGKQLMIDVTSIDTTNTTAGVKGLFPIRGTTWTILN